MEVPRTWLHEIVDPNNTLPPVSLHVPFVDSGGTTPAWAHDHQKKYIRADFVLTGLSDQEETVFGACGSASQYDFRNFEVFHDVYSATRREGYGIQAYLYAINRAHTRGFDFRAHPIGFSGSAKKVWKKLLGCGLAQLDGDGFRRKYKNTWKADIVVRNPERD